MDGIIMMMDGQIIVEREEHNPLLNRVELECVIKAVNGRLKRQDAVKLIAESRGYTGRFIVPIHMMGEKGRSNLRCLFYIYDDEKVARSQLPRYIIARLTGEKIDKGKGKDKKE